MQYHIKVCFMRQIILQAFAPQVGPFKARDPDYTLAQPFGTDRKIHLKNKAVHWLIRSQHFCSDPDAL